MQALSALYLWLTAHWLAIFSAWVALNAVVSSLEAKLGPIPTNTWYGKALHVFVAISPMDVMKALKALGGALVPPMGGAGAAVLLLACGLAIGNAGCASANPSPTTSVQVDPRALADASTALLETAWKDAAQACLDAANAQHDDTIRQKCEPPLTKAREGLLAAQASIDVWGAAEQANYPCLVSQVVLAFGEVAQLGSFKAPQSLVDAENIAQAYVGKCTAIASSDAGKGS